MMQCGQHANVLCQASIITFFLTETQYFQVRQSFENMTRIGVVTMMSLRHNT